MASGLLADVDFLAIPGGSVKQGGIDEVVIDEDFAGGHESAGLGGDEPEVSGAGPDKKYFSRFAHASLRAETA